MRISRGVAVGAAIFLMLTPQPVLAAQSDQCEAAAKAGSEAERARILAAMPEEEGCDGPITVWVDPSAAPKQEALPGFERGTTRPVAGLRDADGNDAVFVEDEVVITTKDPAQAAKFADRWSGTILSQAKPDKSDETAYVVKVKTSLADPARLSDDLAKINEGARKADSLAVSSKEALGLLAVAAQEKVENSDLTIGVNWLFEPGSYATRSLAEAGTGPTGFTGGAGSAYIRDPYKWTYLNSGSVQDIGVTEAWTQLDSVGLLGPNKVDMTILDKGFAPVVNGDLPPGTSMSSMVPFAGAGDPGPSPFPWHGTTVASAAAAVPGNFLGSAGPAGPVANLHLTYTGQDMFLIIAALLDSNNAQMLNMSFGQSMHWALSWTYAPLEATTWLLRETGNMLLFSISGNDGADVDGETCFFACWESRRYAPCELSGVICVGGLKLNSLDRDPLSNYGSEDVNVFAPFSQLVGMDPNHSTPNKVWRADGTSVASPYAMGVAALIWAAKPSLSADGVEDILIRNLRTSPDSKVKKKVINALGSVLDAMPPTVQITSPLSGWTLPATSPSVFSANVFADGHGTPTVTWRANGSLLGVGNPISVIPPVGPQAITATAVWPDGASASDAEWVNVVNAAPTITITNPTPVSPAFGVSEPIPFHAITTDDNGSLPDSSVQWFLDSSTTPFATGHNPTVVTGGGLGSHTVKVRGCDSFTVCAVATAPITLVANPVNQPPVVHITSPANGSQLWVTGSDADGWFWSGTLSATASDPEGFPLTTQWYDNGTPIGSGTNLTARLAGGCGIYGHVLTFTATDPAGNLRQDTVNVTVNLVC